MEGRIVEGDYLKDIDRPHYYQAVKVSPNAVSVKHIFVQGQDRRNLHGYISHEPISYVREYYVKATKEEVAARLVLYG